jgi:hypothetical protein
LTEPEFPYKKKGREPEEVIKKKIAPPPPDMPGEPPPPSPLNYPSPKKVTCSTCGKVFTTEEELTMHVETVHQSPIRNI